MSSFVLFIPSVTSATSSNTGMQFSSGDVTTANGSQTSPKIIRKSSTGSVKQKSKRSSCKGRDSQSKPTNKTNQQKESERRTSNNARER